MSTTKQPINYLRLDGVGPASDDGRWMIDSVSYSSYKAPVTASHKRNPLTGNHIEFPAGSGNIDIPDIQLGEASGLSIMLWFRSGYLKDADNTVLRFGRKENDAELRPFLVLNSSQNEYIQLSVGNDHEDLNEIEVSEGPYERLKHLAISIKKDKGLTIWLNGEEVPAVYDETIDFGQWNTIELGNPAGNMPCELAQFRIFGEALSAEDVREIYENDLLEGAAEAHQPLILHLPMDEIRRGVVRDVSGVWNVASVEGTPDIIYDKEMGSALMFNNALDRVKVKALPWYNAKGIAFSAWIYLDSTTVSKTIFEIKDPKAATRKASFSIDVDTDHKLIIHNGEKNIKIASLEMPIERWTHLAFSWGEKDKENYKFWLDGIDYSEIADADTAMPFGDGRLQVQFCNNSEGRQPMFGRMGHFRLYKNELTKEEVVAIMMADKSSGAATKSIYPIEFKLESIKDNNKSPVLYIEQSNQGSPLELEVYNVSGKRILLNSISKDKLTSAHYHFQLRFRKGVLSEPSMEYLKSMGQDPSNDWAVVTDFDGSDREDVVSFGFGAAKELEKANLLLLQIPRMSASANGGARNTRVEIRFSNMTFVDAPDQNLSGFMMRHLDIISQIGQKNVPLMAFVDGANMMLNDGKSKNQLTLRIYNPSEETTLKLNSEKAGANLASKFTIRFSNPKIIKDNNFKAQLGGDKPLNFKVEAPTKGETTWVFTYNGDADSGKIDPKSSVAIDIKDWVTEFKSGIVNLFIDYKNIPGFWDGTLVVPIDLGLLVEKNKMLGIGTVDPKARLNVSGGQLMIDSDGTYKTAIVFNNGNESKSGYIYNYLNSSYESTIFLGVGSSNDVEGVSTKNYILVKNSGIDMVGSVSVDNLTVNTGLKVSQQANLDRGLVVAGDTSLNANLTVQGSINDAYGALLPVGTVVAYAGRNVPPGWLLCNGGNIAGYSKLREVLGSDYLPDLRDRFIAGAGNQYNPGTTGGANEVTLTQAQMPQHSHSINGGNFSLHHRSFWGENGNERPFKTDGADKFGTDYTGGNQPHENRPPFYALYYIIKC